MRDDDGAGLLEGLAAGGVIEVVVAVDDIRIGACVTFRISDK